MSFLGKVVLVVPCKATILQIAEFFLYIWKELKLSVPTFMGHRATLNYVFSLAGKNLVANCYYQQDVQYLSEDMSTEKG